MQTAGFEPCIIMLPAAALDADCKTILKNMKLAALERSNITCGGWQQCNTCCMQIFATGYAS
jgi:hypothetical protein